MAIQTAAELRNLSRSELLGKLGDAKEELFNLRFQAATGQLESHGRLRAVKKDIARIYTVLTERQLGITEDVDAAPAEAPSPDDAVEDAEEAAEETADEAEKAGSKA